MHDLDRRRLRCSIDVDGVSYSVDVGILRGVVRLQDSVEYTEWGMDSDAPYRVSPATDEDHERAAINAAIAQLNGE